MARHIVLVHGAWQGSWSFALIVPLLKAAGWQVHLIDLPGNGWNHKLVQHINLQSYCDEVIQQILRITEPVLLLGHSGGGLVISQVAEQIPERIEQLVYLAGMLLPSDMTFIAFKKICEHYYPEHDFSGISPYLYFREDGYSVVNAEGVRKIFLQDCQAELTEQLILKFTPQAETGRDLRPILSAERFGTVAKLYIEAVYDQSLPIQMQRLMQQLYADDLEVFSMYTGHVPQAIQPERLVEKLNQFYQG